MTTKLEQSVFRKLVAMFRPYHGKKFLHHDGETTICGPNDRSLFGFDTKFPREWLIEDFDFTESEADWLIGAVKESEK